MSTIASSLASSCASAAFRCRFLSAFLERVAESLFLPTTTAFFFLETFPTAVPADRHRIEGSAGGCTIEGVVEDSRRGSTGEGLRGLLSAALETRRAPR